MSVPNDQTRSTGPPPTSTGRLNARGKRIFRMQPPQVIWWCWVAILVLSVGDLIVQGHRFVSLQVAFAWLAVSGIVYACTLWPAVVADDRRIEVRNPIRRYVIPWNAVRGIFLADSVEVQCARLAPKKDKTVYSWALSSPRRTRARAQLRAWQWDQGRRNRPPGYSRLPQSAQTLVKMTTAEIMARELAAMSDEARFRSVVQDVDLEIGSAESGPISAEPPGESGSTTDADAAHDAAAGAASPDQAGGTEAGDVMTATWSWPPLLAIVLPALAFLVCLLAK